MTKQELERCIDEYGKDIYSFCRHLTNDPQEADDLYQDTFLTAVTVKEKIDCRNNPKSYLLSIALRIWKNKKRKFAWRKRIADMQTVSDVQTIAGGQTIAGRRIVAGGQTIASGRDAEMSPEEQITMKEKDEFIRMAVNRLPEKLKIAVLLFYMEDLSTAQIAETMKIPVGTVLSRLHKARNILKKELEEVIDE